MLIFVPIGRISVPNSPPNWTKCVFLCKKAFVATLFPSLFSARPASSLISSFMCVLRASFRPPLDVFPFSSLEVFLPSACFLTGQGARFSFLSYIPFGYGGTTDAGASVFALPPRLSRYAPLRVFPLPSFHPPASFF